MAILRSLTDEELRAEPVEVTGALTNIELRSSAIAVAGPLTDTQLRATDVDVIVTASALPSGAATEDSLSSIDGKITECDTSGLATEVTVDNIYDRIPANLTVTDTRLLVNVTGIVSQTTPTVSAVTSVAASITSVSLKAVNASRLGLFLFNASTSILYVKLGGAVSATDFTVRIPPLGFYEVANPCYQGEVFGIWVSANGFCSVTEVD